MWLRSLYNRVWRGTKAKCTVDSRTVERLPVCVIILNTSLLGLNKFSMIKSVNKMAVNR